MRRLRLDAVIATGPSCCSARLTVATPSVALLASSSALIPRSALAARSCAPVSVFGSDDKILIFFHLTDTYAIT